jgi:hypothetical protein
MPALVQVHPRAVKLYKASFSLHRDAMLSRRQGRRAEAEFLRGVALVARRWADDAAAAESAAETDAA